jgi:hypothetical protein
MDGMGGWHRGMAWRDGIDARRHGWMEAWWHGGMANRQHDPVGRSEPPKIK